jgi:hypothetical protein
MFGGGGLKSKMLRKMTGMPDMAGFAGRRRLQMPSLPRRLGHQERNMKKKRKRNERSHARRSGTFEGGTIC